MTATATRCAGGVERVPDNRHIDRVTNKTTLPAYCSSNITAATEAMSERMVKYNSSLFQGTQPTVCLSQEVGGWVVACLPLS